MTTRVALITGCGKRDGMGRAIALTLAASGAAVVVTDKQATGVLNRRQEIVGVTDESWGGVDSLVEEITNLGGTAMAQLGDISVAEDAQRMVDAAAAWRGRLDILVNGAGAPQGLDRQDIEDVPIEVFDFVIAVNLRGTYLMSRFAVPHMRAQRWGRIINISSQAGQVSAAMSTAYSASKAGVLGFTRALSADVAPWGITATRSRPAWWRPRGRCCPSTRTSTSTPRSSGAARCSPSAVPATRTTSPPRSPTSPPKGPAT